MKAIVAVLTAATIMSIATAARADGFYISGNLDGVFREAFDADTHTTLLLPVQPVHTLASGATSSGDVIIIGGGSGPVRYLPVPVTVFAKERTNYKAGGELDVAGGYRRALGRYGAIRVEGEFGFRDYQIGYSTVQSLPQQAYGVTYRASIVTTRGLYQQRYAETVNTFYELPILHIATIGDLTPYAGAGVGVQEAESISGDRFVESEAAYPVSQNNYPAGQISGRFNESRGSASNHDGTWLVEGGVSLRMTAHLALTPSYRFTQVFEGGHATKLARIGLRYSF